MIEWLVGADAAREFNNWVLTVQHRPGPIEAALVALGVCVLIWLSVLNLKRVQGRSVKFALLALRVTFIVGLLLLWLQPAIQLQKVLYKKSHVLILVDDSQSMALAAGDGGVTRAIQAADFFSKNADWLATLGEQHHLHAFYFGDRPRSAPLGALAQAYDPTATASSIPNAITQAMAGFNPGDVSGLVLVSDGVNNPPDEPVPSLSEAIKVLKDNEVQVLALAAGSRGDVRDLAIADVRYDGFAFVHNKISIEVSVSSRGYPERAVQVNLDQDGRALGAQQTTLPQDGQATVSFSFTPDRVGRYVYTVAIPPSPDDAFLENNTKRFVIDVIRDKIRVLHVCGHPDYDQQLLRRFLKNNPNVDLISFFILRTNADLQFVPDHELSLIPFPTEELFAKQIHTFDLVIFQNFTYRGYEMEQFLPNIRRFVEQGGAFMVIGGDVSYALGGYDQTAIEPILPFEIVPADPAAVAQPFVPVVTEEGLRHPIMRLAPGVEANTARWAKTPDLLGLNLGLVPYPDSVVLAEHPSLTLRGRPVPVIAARRVKEGRVLAMAIDSSWRWHMADIAAGGTGEMYHTFYSNAIRWLIKDPDLKHLTLRADRDHALPGGELRLDIRLTDEDFQPKGNAELSLRVLGPDGAPLLERGITTDDDGAAIESIMLPKQEGMVRIEVSSPPGADSLPKRDEILVFVTAQSKEFDEVDVDHESLERLAVGTGGKMLDLPVKMSGESPFARTQTARIGQKRDVPIWDKWGVLAVLVLVISLEWWWRKRRRLN
jgi:uncharacterized membrane protein